MAEQVMITIRGKDFCGDFELPFREPYGSYAGLLAEALRSRNPELDFHGSIPRLTFQGKPILPFYTFADCGIYDGAEVILYVPL